MLYTCTSVMPVKCSIRVYKSTVRCTGVVILSVRKMYVSRVKTQLGTIAKNTNSKPPTGNLT